MQDRQRQEPPSFWRSMWDSFVEDQREGLRVARWGALIGALLGAVCGALLFKSFGLIGVGVLLLLGAIVGGIGLWLMYQLA